MLIFISSDGRTVEVLIVRCYGYVLTAISSVTCEKKGDLNVQSEVRDPAKGARCTHPAQEAGSMPGRHVDEQTPYIYTNVTRESL